MKEDAIKILKEKGLTITGCRIRLLSIFVNSSKAFSLTDICNLIGSKINRSTLFRTLVTLKKNNVLENFLDAKGVNIYILNKNHEQCSQNTHFHFKCESCDCIMALPQLPQQYLSVLGNSKVKTLNLLIEGICNNCQYQ